MVQNILTIFFGIAMFIFLTYIFLSLLVGYSTIRNNRKLLAKDQGKHYPSPFYYIIIPAMNEQLVIVRTIKRLLAHKFNGLIIVMDDASTDETAKLARNIANASERAIVITRSVPRAHIGKGDSLNQAMEYIREDCAKSNRDKSNVIVGVIDADASLSKQAFPLLDRFFSDVHNVIAQLRVKMDPDFKSVLQVAQDLEFFSVNNLSQNMRMATNTVGLSGNGQFFRLEPIVGALGWSPWGHALLDDYEMTLKLMIKGIHVRYIDAAYAYQQALTSPYKLMRQRSRWVQGNLDCFKYFLPVMRSRNIDTTQKVGIIYFLIQPYLNLLADISVFGLTVYSIKTYTHIISNHPGLWMETLLVIILLLCLGMFWGILFTIVYLNDLNAVGERIPKSYQIFLLPVIVSYLYLLLFGSLTLAFWRKLRGDNSWIKTARKAG